ncbi:MAG: hypothetical protein WCE62_11475 [Polyangiales bacterium]
MTGESDSTDDGLGERLRELDAAGMPQNGELLEQMFVELQTRCHENDRSIGGFLRSRSTRGRRLIVLGVFSLLALLGWYAFPLVGDHARTAQWATSLVVFIILLLLAMFMVTRPVHLPALPRWQTASLIFLAVAATIVAAFWPYPATMAPAHDHGGGILAGVCMGVGLLLGVPVYALLRLVDRGNAFGSLVAAAAAGVAANFVLKAHCPIPGTSHELLGHASVALFFVVGLGLVHRWIPSK